MRASPRWLFLATALGLTAAVLLVTGTSARGAQSCSADPPGLGTTISLTDSPTHTVLLPLIARSYPDPLTRLENGGYEDLASQLRALPDISDGISATDTEALEGIAALALDATDPEVEEAFDLMVSGGIGSDLVDYGSEWNTQVQSLFWLGLENEFRPNDNLAQAIAMSNGIWVAMGDGEVDQAVYGDTSDLLRFHRNRNPQVEAYPLEALLTLAWRGNYSTSPGREPNHLSNLYMDDGFGLFVYNWNTPDDLEPYRDWMVDERFVLELTTETVSYLERWLYWSDYGVHWSYAGGDEMTLVDGFPHVNHDIGNPDFTFGDLLEDDVAVGDCGDETTIVGALLSSIGIPSMPVAMQAKNTSLSHYWVMYYEPETNSWKSFEGHLNMFIDRSFVFHFYVYRPPVQHAGFLDYESYGTGDERYWDGGMVYRQELTPVESDKVVP
jgi:hypothetical protein